MAPQTMMTGEEARRGAAEGRKVLPKAEVVAAREVLLLLPQPVEERPAHQELQGSCLSVCLWTASWRWCGGHTPTWRGLGWRARRRSLRGRFRSC